MSNVFFDLDKTLITKQSQSLLLAELKQAGLLSSVRYWVLCVFFVFYKLHLVPKKILDKIYTFAARSFKGRSVQEIDAFTQKFVEKTFPKIENQKAVDALRNHQSKADIIVLITAAFEPMAKNAALYFNIPTYTCTKLDHKDGVYTGGLNGKPNYGHEKIEKLSGYDFTNSYGYSDHHSDIPILSKTTYPIAVDPTKSLKEAATKQGWKIL